MLIKYSANNSGGHWWLKDEDWLALEKAGWFVEWGHQYFCHSRFSFNDRPKGKPEPCSSADVCHGHRRFDSYKEAKAAGGAFLDAYAVAASKDFPSVRDAILEFERITGQDTSDEGCNCCGPPHSFRWDNGGCSGESCIEYLFPGENTPKTLREAVEKLKGSK